MLWHLLPVGQRPTQGRLEEVDALGMFRLPVLSIKDFTPYLQRCRLCVRVTSKSGVRTFRNARGDGKLFSMDSMDVEGAATRATVFNASVDKFYPLIMVGQCYDIHPLHVKRANPQYCEYPYEVTFEVGTIVNTLFDDGSIPGMPYDFTQISAIQHLSAGETCDVMGLVIDTQETETIQTRRGARAKRNITLVDISAASIVVSLWGDKATVPVKLGDCVFLRAVRVSHYNGRCLEVQEKTCVEMNPQDTRAMKLRHWYHNGGSDLPFQGMTTVQGRGQKRNLAEATLQDGMLLEGAEGGALQQHRTNVHHLVATVVHANMARVPYYHACTFEIFDGGQSRTCNKKVENGACKAGHECEEPVARYVLPLHLADAYGSIECRAFNEEACEIVGLPAAGMASLDGSRAKGSADAEKAYRKCLDRIHRRWHLTLRCRTEEYEGQSRVQYTVDKVAPVDLQMEAKAMLSEIYAVL